MKKVMEVVGMEKKLEVVRKQMEELAEKQSWIRKGVAEAMKAFEETVMAKRPERFRFRYKLGARKRWVFDDYYNDYYYFYIDEDGIFIQVDHSGWSDSDPTYYKATSEKALADVPVYILKNLGRELDKILDQLAEALKEANEGYGEAVGKLKKLAEALRGEQ